MIDTSGMEMLPISSLNALEYCPRKFYYQFVQGEMLVNEFGHHPVLCVLVELSKEGNGREYYRHRMFVLHSCINTRRKLCLSPRSVPHRPLKRHKWSHRTTPCPMSKNFASACETLP